MIVKENHLYVVDSPPLISLPKVQQESENKMYGGGKRHKNLTAAKKLRRLQFRAKLVIPYTILRKQLYYYINLIVSYLSN